MSLHVRNEQQTPRTTVLASRHPSLFVVAIGAANDPIPLGALPALISNAYVDQESCVAISCSFPVLFHQIRRKVHQRSKVFASVGIDVRELPEVTHEFSLGDDVIPHRL